MYLTTMDGGAKKYLFPRAVRPKLLRLTQQAAGASVIASINFNLTKRGGGREREGEGGVL